MNYTKEATRPAWFWSFVITISSQTGVGSSSTLKQFRRVFADDNSKNFISGGQIMREIAMSLGMTIEEFAKYNRYHPDCDYDKLCDDKIREYGSRNHTIIEGRLPHVFVPNGFHVRLVCPIMVRAERRARDLGESTTVVAEFEKIKERDDNDETRYARLYDGVLWPYKDFDLVLDTSSYSPEEIVGNILQAHEKWVETLRPLIRP